MERTSDSQSQIPDSLGNEASGKNKFQVGPRFIRNETELRQLHAIRVSGFTEWNAGSLEKSWWRLFWKRQGLNSVATLFPGFLHQLRDSEGRALGYLFTFPSYWCGDTQALHDLPHHAQIFQLSGRKALILTLAYVVLVQVLRKPTWFKGIFSGHVKKKLAGCNAIVLAEMLIDPSVRGGRLPTLLISHVKKTAKEMGIRHVIAPFRPSAYGKFKAERNAAHSNALFEEYCDLKTPEGVPKDPWLRSLTFLGAEFLKVEPRSVRVQHPIAAFEAFRARHRPEAWYSPVTDVWECGETPTWYVDRALDVVLSVEPNLWGRIPLDTGTRES